MPKYPLIHNKPRTSYKAMYSRWNMMHQRCNSRSSARWPIYGGRGVRVCKEWTDKFDRKGNLVHDGFASYMNHLGTKPPFKGAHVHRKDHDGDYTPDNVEWADKSGSMKGTRYRHETSSSSTKRASRARLPTIAGKPRSHYRIMLCRFLEMHRRCSSPDCPAYERYGAKGISVCDEWTDKYDSAGTLVHDGFDSYMKHLGTKPPFKGASVDRIDSSGPYSPRNTRWADAKTQSNNRRNVKRYQHDGEVLNHRQLSDRLGIDTSTLSYQMRKRGLRGAIDYFLAK